MYHLSSSLIGGVIAVATLGLFSPYTGPMPQVSFNQSTGVSETVNRAAKGDRLEARSMRSSGQTWKDEFNARIKGRAATDPVTVPSKKDELRVPAEMPVGCEPAVSSGEKISCKRPVGS